MTLIYKSIYKEYFISSVSNRRIYPAIEFRGYCHRARKAMMGEINYLHELNKLSQVGFLGKIFKITPLYMKYGRKNLRT